MKAVNVENSEQQTDYRIVSLFSGCGGLDLGFVGGFDFHDEHFEKLPTHIVYANDFDHDAVECFNHNIPMYDKTAICLERDIRDVDAESIPNFDVLLAGFPCQPFSNAGLRGGVNDKYNRGTLFEECQRIIDYKIKSGAKPAAFIFENVRGIMSSKMNDGTLVVDEIERRMKNLGYSVRHKLIKASDYGVPQNRYRLFIIGVDSCRFKPFTFDSLNRVVEENNIASVSHNTQSKLLLGSIMNYLEKQEFRDDEYWIYTDAAQEMIEQIGPCKHGAHAVSWFEDGFDMANLPAVAFEGRSWKNIPPELLKPRFRKIYDDPKRYHAPNFFRRFAYGEINGTITASGQPENCGITHPVENRRFTVSEIATIQSFPIGFDFTCIPLQSRYKVIGNAVPPVLSWVIGKALVQHLDGSAYE